MATLFEFITELDEKRCWDEWIKPGGSLIKVSKQLEAEGIVSKKTQRAFTPAAIRHAAWRFAVNNEEYAFEKAKFMKDTLGESYSDEDWRKDLKKAIEYLWYQSPIKRKRELRKRGFDV